MPSMEAPASDLQLTVPHDPSCNTKDLRQLCTLRSFPVWLRLGQYVLTVSL